MKQQKLDARGDEGGVAPHAGAWIETSASLATG